MIGYRAALDVPRELVQVTAPAAAGRTAATWHPRGSRALTCFRQAMPGRGGSATAPAPSALASDHGISRATVYRYLDEVIVVLADRAPELREGAAAGQRRRPFACDLGRQDHPCRPVPTSHEISLRSPHSFVLQACKKDQGCGRAPTSRPPGSPSTGRAGTKR